ncbi:MAG: amidase [Pigmentiphaga sp.]|uniref:amidase n=1 Tax=Pigmentiphaga sp. TaxID=1977564 RepID=UPI0029B193F6|nr:amidase [Pigmentiphaga sp.]MDX3904652.1 amidase [Pigmentiphaga sp.]
MPALDPNLYPTACEALALMRTGTLKAAHLMEAALDAIGRHNPRVNAIVHLESSSALLDAAHEADKRRAAGQSLGPLDGLPLTVKDNLWVRGWPATWGSATLRDFRPDTDDAAVACLRQAGAVLVGKTNVPEFALAAITDNAVYGPTRHPFDAALTPGGSSGGAAASVALGMTPFALATDAGGSIRRPAAYTGTVGFKPSRVTVLASNGFPSTSLDFQVIGPIARSVADCALLAATIAAPGMDGQRLRELGQDPRGRLDALAGQSRLDVLMLRPAPLQEAAITAELEAVAARLSASGHRVRWGDAPYELAAVEAVWSALIAIGVHGAVTKLGLDTALLSPPMRALAERGAAMPATVFYEAMRTLVELRAASNLIWESADMLVSPASPSFTWAFDAPFPARIAGAEAGPRSAAVYATFANAVGAPSISLPVPGRSAGEGIGVQLTMKPGADVRLLALAQELEGVLDLKR